MTTFHLIPDFGDEKDKGKRWSGEERRWERESMRSQESGSLVI